MSSLFNLVQTMSLAGHELSQQRALLTTTRRSSLRPLFFCPQSEAAQCRWRQSLARAADPISFQVHSNPPGTLQHDAR